MLSNNGTNRILPLDPPWANSDVTLSQLARLLGRTPGAITAFVSKGLPRKPNGTFHLRTALKWYGRYFENMKIREFIPAKLSQKKLAEILGVHRHSISAWQRDRKFTRNKDGSYDLKRVCQWLRLYYRDIAEREFQKRLAILQKKLCRNVRQLELFFAKDTTILRAKK